MEKQPQKKEKVPALVAHRGYAACFPENTLLAFKEALKAGACFIEFDVQLCADHTPFVIHDPSLGRTCGIEKDLFALRTEEIKRAEACEPSHFGKQFQNQNIGIPTLAEVVNLLKDWPGVTAFVEIKRESLREYGLECVVEKVMEVCKPGLNQCCMISKSTSAIRYARTLGASRIGWVVIDWTEDSQNQMTALSPDVLFCNHEKIPSPETLLWPGPWIWAFYEVTDFELATRLYAQGATLIETKDIGKILTIMKNFPSDDHYVNIF